MPLKSLCITVLVNYPSRHVPTDSADEAYFLQRSLSSPNRTAVKGLLTTGTPHQGSPLGRFNTWLAAHPRGSVVEETGDFESPEWRVADLLLLNGVDVRRPTIGDLSDLSAPMIDLNVNAKFLPPEASYYGIAYNGYELGDATWGFKLFTYNMFTSKLFWTVTPNVRDYILGKDVPPSFFSGDGLVPATSQTFLNKSGLWINKNVQHTDETSQYKDLLDGINSVSKWFN